MSEFPEFDYMYEVGSLRGTVFHVGVRADPSVDDVDSFAAVLFFELSDGSLVEVAKVDDTEHDDGTIHLDRYYRETGAEIKDFDVEISNLWEADAHLQANWRRFARAYLDNHGTAPRDGR